jgi:uncharacterized protein (TIGR00730 family)
VKIVKTTNERGIIMGDTNAITLDIKKNYSHIIKTAKNTSQEITDGLTILKSINKDVISIFGSHVTPENSKDYIVCEKTAYELGKKGYAIMSGGGPGIMKAANAGATRAKTISIGFKAALLKKEQSVESKYYTHEYAFHFLFVRRFCLAVESKALVFFPGGYGTFNELFEYITLIGTNLEEPVPVICVNKKYWTGLFKWMRENALKDNYIKEKDINSIFLVDTPEEVVEIIQKNKISLKKTK